MTESVPANIGYHLPVYSRSNDKFLTWIFMASLLSYLEIVLVGRLFVIEIIFLCCLLIMFSGGTGKLLQKGPRLILALLGFWLFSQVVSDLILGTSFNDYARGWARVFFLAVNFSVLYLLLVTEKRLLVFMLGLSIAAIVNSLQFIGFSTMWKFGGGAGLVILLIVSLTMYFSKRKRTSLIYTFSALILFSASVISIMLNCRSLSALFLLSAVFILWSKRKSRGISHSRLTLKRIFVVSVFSILLIWFLLFIYGLAAKGGWISEKATQKYEMQNIKGYGAWGILLGGRSELVVSLKAISDSPIIGHGSWAKDYKYVFMRAYLLDEMYDDRQVRISESDLIPSHSHVLGAWVEAGIIGGLFWLVIAGMILYNLIQLSSIRYYLVPILSVIFILSCWDILFSPFGAHRRITWALYFVLLIYTSRIVNNNELP